MTTVVTDGKMMVGDAQVTDGGLAMTYRGKIRRIGDHLVGIAGDVEAAELFFRWFETPNMRPPAMPKDFEAMAISRDGIFTYGRRLVPIRISEPFYAIGSGYKLAIGAMEAGASPERAVEIACKRDPYTGLEILIFALEEKTTSTKKRVGRKRSSSS